jgi:hypothetical protein
VEVIVDKKKGQYEKPGTRKGSERRGQVEKVAVGDEIAGLQAQALAGIFQPQLFQPDPFISLPN